MNYILLSIFFGNLRMVQRQIASCLIYPETVLQVSFFVFVLRQNIGLIFILITFY